MKGFVVSGSRIKYDLSAYLIGKVDALKAGADFERLHKIRCKRIAHSDRNGREIKVGPSLSGIKELIDFANDILGISVDFIWGNIGFISDSFGNTVKAGTSNVINALEYYSNHWEDAFREESSLAAKVLADNHRKGVRN